MLYIKIRFQDFRSFWAIAGLAVAVIFTWRALRTPNGSGRRQPKRQAPTTSSIAGVSSQPNANLLPSGFGSSIEDSTQTVSNEFSQRVKVEGGF